MTDGKTRTDDSAPPGGFGLMTHGGASAPRRAFTLIEMLVVLMIIGIVLAIGAGVATRIIARTDEEETSQRLKIVLDAIQAYHDEKGSLPDSLNALAGVNACRDVLKRLDRDCITTTASTVVIKDSFGNPLVYNKTGGFGGGVTLYSKGLDGLDGNDAQKKDDIVAQER